MPRHFDQELIVVVNSTEWRNLCARGTLRLGQHRATPITAATGDQDLSRAFAAAPTTKVDSSVDLLVLQIRPDWPIAARRHWSHEAVWILDIGDVLAHHVVGSEHLEYYRREASKVGVDIAATTYEEAWRRWTHAEMAFAAVEAANALVGHFGLPTGLADCAIDGLRWDELARVVISEGQTAGTDHVVITFVRSAASIDDAAAGVRGTDAYALACCVEWIDHQLTIDPFEAKPIGHVLRSALADARQHEARPGELPTATTQAALDLLHAAFPDAFSAEVTPGVIGALVNLLADSNLRTPALTSVHTMLRAMARHHHASAPLACLLTAAVIGPELTNQLVKATRPSRRTLAVTELAPRSSG